MSPHLTIRRPDDLLAMLPYSLGYQPVESLVVVALADDGVIGPVLRLDLPPVGASGQATDLADRHDLAARLLDHLQRYPTARVVLVVYSEDPRQHHDLVTAIEASCAAGGIDVIDAFGVSGTAWRSMLCADTGCCPTQGHSLAGLQSAPVAAAMVAEGRQVAAGREQLIADLDTATPAERARIAAGIAVLAAEQPTETGRPAMSVWRAAVARARHRIQESTAQRLTAILSQEQAALLLLALRETLFRDALLADYASAGESVAQVEALAGGQLDGASTDAAAAILHDGGEPDHPYCQAAESVIRELARLADPAREPNAWAVLATVRWWAGDGAQASDIAERVLQACGEHTLSELVLTLCRHGVPPTWAAQSRLYS